MQAKLKGTFNLVLDLCVCVRESEPKYEIELVKYTTLSCIREYVLAHPRICSAN